MLGTFVSKKQANIRKGKGKQRKNKGDNNVFQKGVDGQKAKKKWYLKQNRKKRRILKTSLLGEQNIKYPLKWQENNLFGPFYKTKTQKHRETRKHQKNRPKKHLFAFWQTTPYFW